MSMRLLSFVLAAAVGLRAQQVVVSPSGLTNCYGGIDNSVPWGPPSTTLGDMFFQQIDADLVGVPRVLKGFAFRHYYTTMYAARSYTLTLKVGDAASGPAAISATFANNWKTGGSQTTVFSGPLTLPAVPVVTRPPSPPDAPVPFTTPHVYLGTGPLLWEVYYTNAAPLSPTQFYERGPGSTHVAGVLGNGCTVTGGSAPMSSSGSTSSAVLSDTLANGPASAPAALVLGDAADKLGGSLALPLDLALIGSPGCFLNVNALVSFGSQTTTTGTATFSLPYTMSPSVSGIRLRTQWAAIDVASRVRTSNGLDHSVPYNATTGKPWPISRVWKNGFGTTLPVTGTVELLGVVTTWMY